MMPNVNQPNVNQLDNQTLRSTTTSAATKPLGLGDLCIGLVTPPVIVAVIGLQWGGSLLAQLSQFGDDLWRGERLPILHFPVEPPQ